MFGCGQSKVIDLNTSTKECYSLCHKIYGYLVAVSANKDNSRYCHCMVNGVAVQIAIGRPSEK